MTELAYQIQPDWSNHSPNISERNLERFKKEIEKREMLE